MIKNYILVQIINKIILIANSFNIPKVFYLIEYGPCIQTHFTKKYAQ